MTRQGFVMLAVLSWMGATGAVAATLAVNTQRTIRATVNRVQDERAEWIARGCIERAFAHAFNAHALGSADGRRRAWNELSRELPVHGASDGCRVVAMPGGSLLPVNVASEELLGRFLHALGDARSDLAASIVDWIDSDTLTQHEESEAAWYVREARPLPRNTAAVGPADLRWVRSLTVGDSTLLRGFDYRATRVALVHADLLTLRTLPALGPSLIEALVSGAVRRSNIAALDQLERFASPADAEKFREEFPDLAATAALDAEFWLLTMGKLSARIIRAGDALALTDWRREP